MKQKYWIYASLCVFIWGMLSVLIRLTFGSFSAVSLAAARSWIAAITMLIICIVKKIKPPRPRDIPIFFVAGAAGFTVYFVFYNMGFNLVTAATGNVVIAAAPIFSSIIAWIFLKERIRPLGWVFTGVSFIGIIILALWNGVFSINPGVIWLLIAAVLMSTYNLMQRRLTKRYTPIQSSSFSLMAGAILISPILPTSINDAGNAPFSAIAVILGISIASSFSYILWAKAISLAKRTADVANFLYVPPVLGAIIAFIIFREVPDWGTIIGGIVILFGLWMFQKKA